MPVPEALGFDAEPLENYLQNQGLPFEPPFQIEQFRGGQSNPTYRLIDQNGRCFVLRRKPPGKLLPSAHAVEREYRIMSALQETDVPVPETYLLCNDESVIGTAFFVMDFVEGRILWDATMPTIEKTERAPMVLEMARTLAKLHRVDIKARQLEDYGKLGNYFARQISRWTRQYLSDEAAGRLDLMDRLVEWLPENIPEGDETVIVHGDYRLDNMIFAKEEPRVLAILDWELSTLGHPLADLSYSCLAYRFTPDTFNGTSGLDLESLGIPDETSYLAAYAQEASTSEVPDISFHMAFNMFRLAAILHGIQGRIKRGTATSHKAYQGEVVDAMASLAWHEVEKILARKREI